MKHFIPALIVAALLSACGKQEQASAPVAATPAPAAPPAPAPAAAQAHPAMFQPPAPDAIPDNEFGKVVRQGEQIFVDTQRYAKQYVGNSLNCVNCHLDAGRKGNASPLWAAYVSYPAYRGKTKRVNSFAERLQGCFQYSMNGKAPPYGDPVLVALEAYAYWLATGAPVGTKMEGRGYPALKAPAQPADYDRGEKIYAQSCAVCHGANGEGQYAGGKTVFPPLWGEKSFNWGAGMHDTRNASAFIKANMPLGAGGSLTEQEAWDVATFMNSHERPQDPRFAGSVAETRKKYHDEPTSLYGTTVKGRVLGAK